MLRYLVVLVLILAGLIRSPFLPFELTNVPAHQLFYAALGAAQLMLALYFLWQPKPRIAQVALLLSGSNIILVILSQLIAIPFTNIAVLTLPAILAFMADIIACATLLLITTPHTRLINIFACVVLGGVVWGLAHASESHFPDLAHYTTDQFEVFDQVAMLSATDYAWDLPPGFPVPYVPPDNPMTQAKVELGRYLFYDPRLSGNNTMSCSSCHIQSLAFTDGRIVPIGSTGEAHIRNSQSLTNVAYNATFTWGNPVLTQIEQQVVIPMFGEFPVEMGITGNEDVVLNRLMQDPLYQQLFAAAFPDEANPVTYHNIVQALSSFVRTMISGNSPYDRFVYQGDTTALSESALRGMNLFLSEKFECHHCHGGFNFTLSTRHANTTFPEQPFFNTGLYNIDGAGAYPRGNRGVFEITGNPDDMGHFRPPTLRNIALTAPYMHDGSIATLEEVILFYAAGGRNITNGDYIGDGRANPYKSGFVPGFQITDQEMQDLINFLISLTDEQFITDPKLSNPFESP